MSQLKHESIHNHMRDFAAQLVDGYFKDEINFPDPMETPESKRERKIEDLTTQFEEHHIMIAQAAEVYKAHDKSGKIAPIINKIENAPEADFTNPDFLTDSDYEILMEAAVDAYNDSNYNTALLMAAYVAHIFPIQVQPYILMTTVYWAQEGVQKAAQIYDQLIPVLPNPMLYLYAARCYVAADERDKAIDILTKAQAMIETEPETFISLRDEVISELDTMSQHH